MAIKPFALERLASKVNLAGKKARQDYFDTKASEATNYLSSEVDKLKNMQNVPGGFLGKGSGFKSLGLKLIGNLIAPGLGNVLSLAAGSMNTVQQQKQYKNRLKKLKKDINIPAKYKGTFMEDYIMQNLAGNSQQVSNYLKSAKSTNLITGLVSAGLDAASVGKGFSKTTTAGKSFGVIDEEGISSIATLPGVTTQGKLGSFIDKLKIPFGKGISAGVKGLTNPLASKIGLNSNNDLIQRLLEDLTTPSSYGQLAKQEADKYLNKSPGESMISALQAPKYY